jgi:hypothetical protein
MSKPIYFAPYQTPFVNLQTGIISREWYLFLQAMFNRVGGSTGQGTDDLLQGIPNELGAAELLALQSTAADAAGQMPPMLPVIAFDDQSPPPIPDATFDDLLSELCQAREQVGELQKRIQDLQQGPVSL